MLRLEEEVGTESVSGGEGGFTKKREGLMFQVAVCGQKEESGTAVYFFVVVFSRI